MHSEKYLVTNERVRKVRRKHKPVICGDQPKRNTKCEQGNMDKKENVKQPLFAIMATQYHTMYKRPTAGTPRTDKNESKYTAQQ